MSLLLWFLVQLMRLGSHSWVRSSIVRRSPRFPADSRLAPAIAFYLSFPVGTVVFAVMPGLRAGSVSNAFLLALSVRGGRICHVRPDQLRHIAQLESATHRARYHLRRTCIGHWGGCSLRAGSRYRRLFFSLLIAPAQADSGSRPIPRLRRDRTVLPSPGRTAASGAAKAGRRRR